MLRIESGSKDLVHLEQLWETHEAHEAHETHDAHEAHEPHEAHIFLYSMHLHNLTFAIHKLLQNRPNPSSQTQF